MCGITGFYNFDKRTPDLNLLHEMGDVIAHKGPDHEGYYTNTEGVGFCHRRLSIIDLSEKGNQPMSNADETIWLIFNGEIYNYKELRRKVNFLKGYKFKSDTDTEVVINAYLEYGENCVTEFNGMFAFSIWDVKNKIFFAAEDKLELNLIIIT